MSEPAPQKARDSQFRPRRQPNRRRPRHYRTTTHLPVGDAFVARLGGVMGRSLAHLDDLPEGWASHPVDPQPHTPIEELRFVALDCETTGQYPHRLVELGAVSFTLTQTLASFETLVHSNDRINPYAQRIHHISSTSLAGAPPIERVIERFSRFIEGSVLVEHSADAFDTRLVAALLGPSWKITNLDTSKLARKLWELKDTIGLERLCKQLDVHNRNPHYALGDAEATANCFIKLVAMGQEAFHWQTLQDLITEGQPPPPKENTRVDTKHKRP